MKDAPADAAPVAARRRRAAPTASLADYVALTKPRLNFLVVATSAAGYYLGGPARPDVVAMAQAVARHGARRRRRGGAESGLRARHRRADAAHAAAPAAGRPRVARRRAHLRRSRCRSPASCCSRRAPTGWRRRSRSRRSSSTWSIYTPMKRRTSLVDARRRGARRAAAAHRLDRVARQRRASAARRSSPSCSSGRFRISWRSRGCIATTTARPASRCCRSSSRTAGAPAGRRCSTRRCCCRSASLPTLVGVAGTVYFGDRAGARLGAARGSPCASPTTRTERVGARAVLRLDHLSAAPLDRR